MTDYDAVDLFSGPRGWGVAARRLGIRSRGLELDPAAVATSRAAGFDTIQCDVAVYDPALLLGVDGVGASPVCPPFGKSGNKLGLTDLPLVQQAIADLAAGKDTRDTHGAGCLDPRSILTAEPMRYLTVLHPKWVVLEQVPSVLPVWEQYAAVLRGWGYSVVTAVVDAADYGLGQQRKRAILAASRVREARLPEPTHGPGLFTEPHVSMADVVGWGYTQRPAPTVTSGGTYTGGAEPFGNGTRQAMKRAIGTPAWMDRNVPPLRRTGAPDLRPTVRECAKLQGFPADHPFTGRAGQQYLQAGNAVPPRLAGVVLTAAGAGARTKPALEEAA